MESSAHENDGTTTENASGQNAQQHADVTKEAPADTSHDDVENTGSVGNAAAENEGELDEGDVAEDDGERDNVDDYHSQSNGEASSEEGDSVEAESSREDAAHVGEGDDEPPVTGEDLRAMLPASDNEAEAVDAHSTEGSETGGDDEAVEEAVLVAAEEASLHSDSGDNDSEEGDDSEGSEASEDSFSEHTDNEEMELEKNKMLKNKGDKHGYDPVRRTDRKKHPAGFQRPLMPHQLESLGWMRRHELNDDHCGGILADEPGAGKTITMAAFLVYMKPHNRRLATHIDGKRRANALIVVPKSVLLQWEAQLAREFLVPGALNIVLFYGPKRFTIRSKVLAEADAVITTPDVLRIDIVGYERGKRSDEEPENKLGRFHWTRFIVDEAHRNRSEESNSTQALQEIFATYRWCISGTPIDGRASDAEKLLSFLGCRWTPWKTLTLRRTKEDIVKKKKIFRTLNVRMKGLERKAYEQMTQFLKTWREEASANHAWRADNQNRIREQVERANPRLPSDDYWGYRKRIDSLCEARRDFHKNSSKWESLTKAYPSYSKVSGDLLKIRFKQAAVHLAVAEKAVNKEMATEALSGFDTDVQRQMIEAGLDASSVFDPGFENAKIKALMRKLVPIVESGDKCTVVTQYRSALKIVGLHLSKKGISYETMHGGTTAENRWDIVRRFNDANSDLKVVLLAIQSCGVGVDLPGGNHMFMLEPQESGADEEQAFDRHHRIGQNKDVYCWRMITVGTIEEEIAQQRKKRMAATNSLLGNRSG